MSSLMSSMKKGSGTNRKVISRSNKYIDVHNLSKWKAKLGDNLATRSQVGQPMINLQSKYICSDTADTLSRLRLGKPIFGNQLFKIGITDTLMHNLL